MPCAQIRDLTGHLIDEDRLILVKQLGQGSFGHVYRAIHAACSSKIFAVKVAPLPAPGSRENDFLNREGLIHELLSDHPNIVTMHRKFRTEKHAFMVMDFCDGGDLFDAIDSKVFRGDTALLKHVFVQILDAVAYCHERGVYHRDIKPENILYSSDGMAFLTDFGLSTQSKFSDVFRIGSPYYMSPECLGEGQRALVYLNRPNDIWSLGIVLVNMLTGAYPWSRAWSQDVCYQEYLRDPDILYDIFPISRSATELLKKVFEVEPLGRLAITKFREEVSAVDEFFKSDAEFLTLRPDVQERYADYHCAATSMNSLLSDDIFALRLSEKSTSEITGVFSDDASVESMPMIATPDDVSCVEPNPVAPDVHARITTDDIPELPGGLITGAADVSTPKQHQHGQVDTFDDTEVSESYTPKASLHEFERSLQLTSSVNCSPDFGIRPGIPTDASSGEYKAPMGKTIRPQSNGFPSRWAPHFSHLWLK